MAGQKQFVIDARGKKTGVIVPVKHYEKLLEDLHDLAVFAERREEKPIGLEEIQQRLKENSAL